MIDFKKITEQRHKNYKHITASRTTKGRKERSKLLEEIVVDIGKDHKKHRMEENKRRD